MSTVLSRRLALKGLLFGVPVSLALPPLEAMLNGNGTAWANGAPLPKRFGLWFFANGVKRDRWVPAATGPGYAPSPSLQPFADAGVLDAVSVCSNMSYPWPVKWAHATGDHSIYTGAEPIYDSNGFPGTDGGPRIDDVIADAWSSQTPQRKVTLQISRAVSGADYLTGDANAPMYNPQALFDQLFAGFMPKQVAAPSLRSRHALLDVVSADARALKARLGAADQARLDQHLSSLSQLARNLDAMPPQVAACTVPGRPGPRPADLGALKEDLKPIHDTMSDLLCAALACDVTRVFELTFMAPQSSPIFWQVGVSGEHHPLGHDEGGNQPQIQQTIVFCMTQLASLTAKLKAVPMGAGTLLDQVCMLVSSEHNDPQNHGLDGIPALMIGKAGGALKGGVHSATSGLHSRFLLTALQACGLPQTSFGVGAGQTNAPLTELFT